MKLLRSLNVAPYRLIFLEDCFVSVCPIRQDREREHRRFECERERGLISESNRDSVILMVRKDFNVFYDLVFSFREVCQLGCAVIL